MSQRRRTRVSVLWLSCTLVMGIGCNSASSECPGGEVFVDGLCRLACVEGACPVGQVCQQGYCAKAFAPGPPEILSSVPASPSNETQPLLTGIAEANTTIRIYTNPECAGDPVASGSVRDFGSVGLQVTVSPNSTTALYAAAEGPGQLLSDCSAPAFTYVEDSTPPLEPTLQGLAPASPANDNNPTISGIAEPDTTVSIHTDRFCNSSEVAVGSASDFASPGFALTVDDDTETTFHVRVTDEGGNSICSTSFATYIEDSTPPTFAGLVASRGLSQQEVALSWQVASDTVTPEGDIVYDVCASTLDGGCASFSSVQNISGATTVVVSSLAAETRHFFVVRARDAAGNRDDNTVQGSADTCVPGFGLDEATAALYVMDGGALDDTLGRHHGRLSGTTPEAVTGRCESAFSGGADHWGVIPDEDDWDEVVSVDFWVWLPSGNGTPLGIVSRDAYQRESNGHLDFSVLATGVVQVRLQDLTADYFLQTADSLARETWVHLGVNLGPPGFELWVNGDVVDANTSVLSTMRGNANPWVIGASAVASVEGSDEGSGQHFVGGRIDELRLSTRRRDFSACSD